MNRFDYLRPATVEEAVAAAAAPGAAYLAGGTNLLDLMKVGAASPSTLVDVTRLPGLDAIEDLPDGGLRIGAMVRNSDVARAPAVLARFPMVAEALLSGASAQLRNAATVGGNILQRPRAALSGGLAGEPREHAVLGWTEACRSVHPSDFAVPLAALGAVLEIAGPDGRRQTPLAAFFSLPEGAPEAVADLRPGELVTALILPAEAAGLAAHARYVKLRERTSFAFALVSAAAALEIEGGAIARARLALGGVAHRPWRAEAAEAALVGKAPGPDAFAEAAALALAEAKPSGDNAFKIELARRTAARALALAAAGTPARMPALPASPFDAEYGAPAHV
ncbi:FAD binding domain-containing protein [Albimonas sp. CAU 1670]|uniref:FAD binding domain-containing protein n=1 Tax=Albimonas sp. CAU 1670 TaxID=3032599 RepID=UPI0023DB87A6|nr:FAD binding domain-containing protein [Albimonas sp. CAU 1670]MDF2233751.1 FAD binding domain-containing protein [Albimonas sp. CAU 1670]